MSVMQAVKDKIIVEMIETENKTKGGIVLPDSAKAEPQSYGKVISVGKDVNEISVDDVLAFNERAGMDIVFDGDKYKCLGDSEVYAIINE